jgi:6-phosphogluconolactonase
MSSLPLFIGTYTRASSKGIYAVSFDPSSGSFSAPKLAAETANPSYVTLSPDGSHLYAVSESHAMAAAFRVGTDRSSLTPFSGPQNAEGKAPCHLMVDHTGKVLLLTNYHSGIVAALPINADGSLGAASSIVQHRGSSVHPERQSSPHAHSVTVSPDNRYALVCDLGLDQILTYRLDPANATLAPAEPPFVATAAGSGPRHFAFSPDGRRAFVVSEMAGSVTAYDYDARSGSLRTLDTQSTLRNDFRGENKSAAIRVHPNGRFVYASNRGPDDIAVFSIDQEGGKLTRIENVPSGGKGPRDFALSRDGEWLVAANQDTNSLTAFQVSPDTGRLTPIPTTATISMPVCVLFAD